MDHSYTLNASPPPYRLRTLHKPQVFENQESVSSGAAGRRVFVPNGSEPLGEVNAMDLEPRTYRGISKEKKLYASIILVVVIVIAAVVGIVIGCLKDISATTSPTITEPPSTKLGAIAATMIQSSGTEFIYVYYQKGAGIMSTVFPGTFAFSTPQNLPLSITPAIETPIAAAAAQGPSGALVSAKEY